jgi:hypothetical protein
LGHASGRIRQRLRTSRPDTAADVPLPQHLSISGNTAPERLLRRPPAPAPQPAVTGGRPAASTKDPTEHAAGAHRSQQDAPTLHKPRRTAPPPADRIDGLPSEHRPHRDSPAGGYPTESEKLGPAPISTPSHPAMVAPASHEPPMPVASASIHRGAGRDAAVPSFLDDEELTRRIARVLHDEARRHGIGA